MPSNRPRRGPSSSQIQARTSILIAKFFSTQRQQARRNRAPFCRDVHITSMLAFVAAVAAVALSGRVVFAKSKPVPWKTIDDAILRVNDVAVKDWSVYQTGKKRDPLLLQIGNRFLLIEVHDQQLFEIDSSKVARRSDAEVDWDPADRPSQPLASSDWRAGDVGAAMQITLKITAENRAINLELPHPPDVGDLPVRSTAPQRHR